MTYPGLTMYCSTKVFTTYIAECLNFEWKGKVDVMSYRPASVDTNMNPNKKNEPGFILPERAAETCFRDLGYQPVTYGHSSHHWVANLIKLFPHSMLDDGTYKAMNLEYETYY